MKTTTLKIAFVLWGLMALPAMADVKDVKFVAAKAGGDANLYSNLPDLAYVEAASPLSQEVRMKITAADLKKMNQEQLDQIYARIASGPIPEGDFQGSILVKHPLVTAIESKSLQVAASKGIWGKLGKWGAAGLCGSKDRIECLGEFMWSGKRFYPKNQYGQIQLRNAVSPLLKNSFILKKAGLEQLASAMQSVNAEVFNASEMRLMMFPANVYCGQSLTDARKEAVVIDYAYGDDFQPYIPEMDSLVGRDGIWIRDEIRMVRPGLYLGRAYLDRIFLLNFVLEKKNHGIVAKSGLIPPVVATGAEAWKNSCWAGASWQ